MKKLLSIFLLTAFVTLATQNAYAQMWSNGNKVQFFWPAGATGFNYEVFPSVDTPHFKSTVDTFYVTPWAKETYITLDTLKHVDGDGGVKVLSISNTNGLHVGQKIYVQTQTIDSLRTTYVNFDGARADTIVTKSKADVREYFISLYGKLQKYPY